jgi:hypothetical protein
MPMLFLVLHVSAQKKSVTGKVVDQSTGKPLGGASIQLENTKTIAIANDQGVYSINVDANSKVLVVSYVSYATQKININGKSVVDVKLVAESITSNEVVVIGYGGGSELII